MSQPRQVLPASFYLLSRRCTQRMFLLRPDEETNNAYLYCLIVAAQRYDIDVMMMCAMSNHHHVAIFDRHGRYPEFLEHMHKLIARSQNALRGRWENFWASGQASVVELIEPDDVIGKIVYVAGNPVNDDLVECVHHWPGINGYRALITGATLEATRPRHFFRKKGPLPERVAMQLAIPRELGDAAAVRERVETAILALEETAKLRRAAEGRRVAGRRAVLQQSWKAAPTSFEQRRGLNPRVAARSVWARMNALARNRAFVRAYQIARAAWRDGLPAVFPLGTYWLRRFANVAISAA